MYKKINMLKSIILTKYRNRPIRIKTLCVNSLEEEPITELKDALKYESNRLKNNVKRVSGIK
jgi:hypothetical protein